MAPLYKVEFITLKLKFAPYLHPQYPRITLTRKTHSPSGAMTQVRDWFNRVMSLEKAKISPNLSIYYSEWNITTGNANLFFVQGYRFDKILVVFGQEHAHFNYYQNMPSDRRIEGCQVLSVNFCGCCLNHQYLHIIDWIKRCIMKEDGFAQ